MAEEKEEKGFVIKDRRIFGEEGEGKKEQPPEKEKAAPREEKKASENSKLKEEAAKGEQQARELPPVDFPSFLLSLYTSAAFHFGDMADPATGKTEKNLPAAKQMIDIIALLKEKTRGNLDANEAELIEGLLYDLRMRFVKES